MKTYTQFFEDIEQRRKKLHQKRIEQMAAHKEKVAAYRESQREKERRRREKEEIKAELRRELQTEQVPVMKPNEYNKQIAMRQATQKSAHIKHVHGELGAEARAQQAAKQARLKAIMSR